jgi:predicted metal-dependent hydrolase
MKYNFNIIIKRTNRIRTVSFLVKNQELTISVPKLISDKEIDRLILSKLKWINKKLRSEKLNPTDIPKCFVNDEKLMLFGKSYFLKLI